MNLSKAYLRIGSPLVLMVVGLLTSIGPPWQKTKEMNFAQIIIGADSKRVSVSDLREIKLPALSLLEVDGKQKWRNQSYG